LAAILESVESSAWLLTLAIKIIDRKMNNAILLINGVKIQQELT